jgi:hypothetical protein
MGDYHVRFCGSLSARRGYPTIDQVIEIQIEIKSHPWALYCEELYHPNKSIPARIRQPPLSSKGV